ncbi:MAG: phenylalanine--tRNA ligase subunit beta, partial [Bacteroidaceae bacterium]|nr:phenylalanine--tRNA ligase subunit beta [Bacteroidaceae bacterium]
TGCEIKPSPEWLQTKLKTIGLRPINNIVDITNYIMMAYGQPLHCFDADMIEGKKIVVRTMPEGTNFVSLDGTEHKLSDRDLVICNEKEPMCIAGVIGGKGSGTYEKTTNVVFESAYFNPTMIRKSARRHGFSTDASFRFERGIDPNGQIYALKQAAMLAKELAGGKVSMEIVDVKQPDLKQEFDVKIEYSYINNLVGKEIPKGSVKTIVTALEMKIVEEIEEGLSLKVPAYRVDVQRPCDIVEDILRIYGYNNVEIPSTLKSSLVIKGEADKSHRMQNIIGEQLVGCGFNEILNNSLTKAAYYDNNESYKSENLVRLMNPLSSDLNVLRQSLVFGGLECIAHNVNRRNANLRFFEFGNCYSFDEGKKNPEQTLAAYKENFHLGVWVTGKRVQGSWAHADEDSSFYELKSYVMNIFARLGFKFGLNSVTECKNDLFSVAQAINNKAGVPVVMMGILSKKVTSMFDIEQDVFFADINWNLVMKAIKNNVTSFVEIAKFPAVSRDLALLVDKKVKFSEIEAIAYQSEKKLLKNVALFDVYEGKNLEEGKKSYAVNFTLQNDNATLNDKQIEKIMQNIINNLQKNLDAKLR